MLTKKCSVFHGGSLESEKKKKGIDRQKYGKAQYVLLLGHKPIARLHVFMYLFWSFSCSLTLNSLSV